MCLLLIFPEKGKSLPVEWSPVMGFKLVYKYQTRLEAGNTKAYMR